MLSSIKLIALDLDGTIVDAGLKISDRTQQILQRVQQERNIRVILATGRMFLSTLPFVRTLKLANPVISYQGAMIREVSSQKKGEPYYPILYHQGIAMDAAEAIVEFIRQENLHANVYVNDALFTTQFNPNAPHYQRISGVVPQEVPNLHQILTASPSKIMIIDDHCDEVIATLRTRFPSQVSICKSRKNYCEIVHSSVSKWHAIERMIDRWNIQPEEVMAIGDHENDLPMILKAGIGVAMGNSPENVKSQARHITDSIDEDGVVKAIEKFIYGNGPEKDALYAARNH